jgi:glucose-6-phosphate 1-epimerase
MRKRRGNSQWTKDQFSFAQLSHTASCGACSGHQNLMLWEKTQSEGKNGLPMVTLFKGSEYSVEIYLHGATVTSWRHSGIERIFVSSLTVWNGIKAIRGGIPVVWPQFGQPDPSMPQHGLSRLRFPFLTSFAGFLRNSPWSVHEILTTENEATVTFLIDSTPETLLLWPHPFRAFYTVTISEEGLVCRLKTINNGETAFKCHALLHTYFSIPNISEVSFSGYDGLQFADKTRDNQTFLHTDEAASSSSCFFQITEEVDRVYLSSSSSPSLSSDVTIHHLSSSPSPLMTIQRSAQIESQFSSFVPVPCDCVLWNPWVDKSKALADMDDEGYLSFVCVEPGVVSEYVTVAPGEALNLTQRLIPSN